MSLSGRLEDVAAADVMQFVHLGRRTGTLSLTRGDEKAEVNFHRGAIVGAWSPRSKKLGELLLERGLIDQQALHDALVAHAHEEPRRSLGQVLLSRTAVPVDAVRRAIREQIEQTIYELVGWTSGSFNFELGALKPVDDVAVYPGDLIPDLDLNTQMVLLEAAKIFDERNRMSQGSPEETLEAPATETSASGPLATTPEFDALDVERPLEAAPTVHLVTEDDELAQFFERGLLDDGFASLRLDADDIAGAAVRGGPLVVFDIRSPAALEKLQASARWWPRVPTVALVGSLEDTTAAYAAGAVAAVPVDQLDAIRACVGQLCRMRDRGTEEAAHESLARAGFAKLRRVVSDLRSGVFSVSVALNLMNTIAESVERAVLFFVKGDRAVALGAFGFDDRGRPLAERTRGLEIELDGDDLLSDAARSGHAISLPFERARLPSAVTRRLGRPRSDQVVVFPVVGSDRVILLIYTDNGKLEHPIEEIDILDLVAAEVGIAFENELLRRQLADG
jgi:Domain of unknown function (DUF4388)